MERLTKREGKHTIRIGNEWRRHDPVWERLAYYEDLFEEATNMLESYEQHGDVYTINDDNTLGEKIGTCSIIRGVSYEKI